MTPQLVVGPIKGYRLWYARWDGNAPVLQSLHRSTIWPTGGPLQATCEQRPASLAAWIRSKLTRSHQTHPSPAWQCACGIYALRHLEDGELPDISPGACARWMRGLGVQVLGGVLLWGRVIQHEKGFRAKYARPMSLARDVPRTGLSRSVESEIEALFDAVAKRYGIPLVSRLEELTGPG